MPSKQEEEFELILGNKQLLSLFFVVVVFFAGFFAVGYTVGFNHGEKNGPPPTLVRAEASTDSADDIRLPKALLKDAPGRIPPDAKQADASKASQKNTPAKAAASKPKPTAPKAKPTPTKPAARKPAASRPAAEGGYHLQVAAVRVRKDADMLAGKLKGMGHPASVRAGSDWNRVVVGPFASSEAAKGYRGRLRKDGFDTLVKRF